MKDVWRDTRRPAESGSAFQEHSLKPGIPHVQAHSRLMTFTAMIIAYRYPHSAILHCCVFRHRLHSHLPPHLTS